MNRSRNGSIEVTRVRGVALVRLGGTVDEHSAAEIHRIASIEGAVVLDLDQVTRITSYGVREWVSTLDAMVATYYCFVRCRPAMAAQFNMIRNFARKGEVLSLYAPYVCPSCGEEFELLLDVFREHDRLGEIAHQTAPCPQCKTASELDDLPESYFAYVRSVARPQPPPSVAAVLSVPFRIGKEVTADLTALWLAGTLDASARLKRAIDGLEGRVLIVMGDLVSVSLEGFQAVAKLFKLSGVEVTLAQVPENVASQLLDMRASLGSATLHSLRTSIVCSGCGHEQPIEIRRSTFQAGAILECTQCHHPLPLSAELRRFAELPWMANDDAIDSYLASSGPTAGGAESAAYPLTAAAASEATVESASARYEIVKTLGYGGMGSVYLARAVRPGGFERLVAVKRMHPHLAGNPASVAMFLDEARLAARIHHPNVVATIDVVETKDAVSLIMEYVEGLPLCDILERMSANTRLATATSLRIICDALTGLHAAHETVDERGEPMNLVHRDVSAKNLLVGSDGTTRVVDFGIALSSERRASTTEPGFVKGTLGYIAPEQARGLRVDRRADIFAMGLVACELLFVQDRTPTMLAAFLRGEALAAQLAADADSMSPLDRALVRACLPAMKVDPDERYPTALAFLEAIERAAASAECTPASAREVGALVASVRGSKTSLSMGAPK